jgi:arylsulfatase A-like enzyme/lipopolysaccharide biosynthesis regulator YciM
MTTSCKAAFLLAALALGAACGRRETPAGVASAVYPNAPVIIISIDTLRADHLPAYGYKGVETPNLDRLRADSVLYSHAYSHVPLTLPSHVSMLTGELPPDNGVRNNIGFLFDAAKHATIPSILKAKGYATGAAVSAYVLRANTGLAAAFDSYDSDIAVKSGEAVGNLQRPGGDSVAVAERWIDAHAEQPFFYMLHLFEPHSPYQPAEEFRTRYASAPYDGEIATADAIAGRFLDYLKEKKIYDRAVIILMSDHGEGLNQHGESEHGVFLYMEDIHVPLMLKLPDRRNAGTTVDAPVQLIDIMPTVAALTGATAPPRKGRSLLAAGPARRIYSESLYPRIHLGWSDLRSLVDERFHYIDVPRAELYTASDPAEKENVLSDNRRVAASMRTELEPFGRDMPTLANIDPEEAKKLAALGYLSATSADSGGPLPDPKDGIADINLVQHASQLERRGDRDAAIAEFRQVLTKNPRLTDAWTLLAGALETQGKYDEAIATYKRAIQIAPSIAEEFSLSIANLYLMSDRPAEAIEHAQIGLKTNGPNAHLIIGRALMNQGKFDQAEREAAQVMDSFSYRPNALVLLAQIRVKQRRIPEAAKLIDDALADVQSKKLEVPALLYFARGDAFARMNRPDDAIASFQEEIRRFPHDRQAYANLTVIHLLTGHRAEANRTMELLVSANPEPKSYEIAAKTFAELGDGEDAAAWRRRIR